MNYFLALHFSYARFCNEKLFCNRRKLLWKCIPYVVGVEPTLLHFGKFSHSELLGNGYLNEKRMDSSWFNSGLRRHVWKDVQSIWEKWERRKREKKSVAKPIGYLDRLPTNNRWKYDVIPMAHILPSSHFSLLDLLLYQIQSIVSATMHMNVL